MVKNIFKDFVWEKCDGGAYYRVTYIRTGKSLIAIPRLGKNQVYCIDGSTETEKNCYGQDLPKRYNKFEIMEYLKNMEG